MEAYKPRFHPKTEVPVPPEGHFVAKFHGEPIFLPEPEKDEPLVGRTQFTQRQVDVLKDHARNRMILGRVISNTFPTEQRLRGDLIVNLN